MLTVRLTSEFESWLDGLRDKKAQVRIAARLRQAETGNLGDWKPVGTGVSEMRVNFGPGYRLYYCRRGEITYLLLCAGDKSSQQKDINTAKTLLKSLEAP